jgi:hypothetical protein
LHTNRQKERLVILNSQLGRYHIQPDKTVSEYSRLLSRSFDCPPGLSRFCLDMLLVKKEYKDWKSSKHNCMLVLNGHTVADQTSCCWISPASVEIASAFQQETRSGADGPRVAVAELYCQKSDFMADNIKPMAAIVCLFLQLLEADSSILKDAERFEGLRARFTNLDSKSHSDFKHVCELLVEVMQKFDLVYFIIDRADRISGDFIKEFLRNIVLAHTGIKVKTLCVVSRDQQGMARKIEDLNNEMDEKNFISLCINQDRLVR